MSLLQNVILDVETTSKDPHRAKLLSVGVLNGTTHIFSDGEYPAMAFSKPVIGHNIKYDAVVVRHNLGHKLHIKGDTMVMQYVLNPKSPLGLKELFKQYFNEPMADLLELYNEFARKLNDGHKDRKNLPDDWFDTVPSNRLKEYLTKDLTSTLRLYNYLYELLQARPELLKWYHEIEIPICEIIADTEFKGVRIDRDKLSRLGDEFKIKANALEKTLVGLTGDLKFNLNSPKQLQKLLYEDFKLPRLKKTKTGYSTDAEVIEKLADMDYFCSLLTDYRTLDKLCGTYIDPIISRLDSNNRLRCQFNNCLTSTRRLSCEKPNLQNIPTRSKLGQLVKDCLIPDEGHQFLICDYDQVELRILAHFSEDPNLIECFMTGVDIHQRTADLVGKDRATGKLLNFSLIYGKTSFGFAKDWGVSIPEAESVIADYFKAYPRVKEWIEEVRAQAKIGNGYIKTLSGLPLYVGDVHSNNKWTYAGVMRNCVNYPIQGSSQDIIKKAMVNIYKDLGMTANLMVHDELVFNVVDNAEKNIITKKIVSFMENAWKLKVPLKVTYHLTDRWSK